jgi:integrase
LYEGKGFAVGRSKEKFSDFRLKAAVKKFTQAGKRGLLSDGGNLYLSITPPEASSWVFRFMLNGAARTMGLGSYPDVSLAAAREMAGDARKLRGQGRDPIEVRRTQAATARAADAKLMTFNQCAAEYIASHRKSWTSVKHAGEWGKTLATYASPIIGKLPVGAIDTALVMKVLRQKTPDGTDLWTAIPETASRLRGRIESVLGFAKVSGFRTGDNPAAWKNHLQELLPARSKTRDVKHLDAMPYTVIADFMAELRSLDTVDARALEFLILTAGRTAEILGARWSEIDLTARTWMVPGNRMKGGRPHRVVLSDAGIACLPPQAGEYVFARRVGRHHADPSRDCRMDRLPADCMRKLMRLLGRSETAHGFRATFKTWATERTSYPRELIEVCLSHAQTDALELAYQRGEQIEKRRRLMNEWARHCVARATSEVVPLRAAQS